MAPVPHPADADLATLPPSPAFAAWLRACGERPPDFAALPSRPDVWNPASGARAAAAWPARRAAIRARWRRWLLGSAPVAPANLHVREARRRIRRDGVEERLVDVRPAGLRTPPLGLRLLLPAGAATPPPVLLTQTSHAGWAEQALARGWAACLVRACDDDDDMDAVAAAMPGYDWSRLARRAWALSRALDVLRGVPEVDATRVVLAGHSRNGKAAVIAAAHDDRFAAVVSSSSGVLGAMPARLCTDRHFGEGVELLTRHYPEWFHPRLRFFSGREDRLPTDAHELLACIAPRPLLVSVAQHDQVESTWAAERTVEAIAPVWSLLRAPQGSTLRWRDGGHAASEAAVEGYLDWAGHVLLGRGAAPGAPAVLHGGGWRAWPAGRLAPPPGWRPRGVAWTQRAVARAVGRPGELGTAVAPAAPRRARPAGRAVRPAPASAADGVVRLATTTADGVAVDVFAPARAARPGAGAPLVLWLAPLCRPTGYRAGYEQGEALHLSLARDGFAVACHDPIGTGTRLLEGAALAQRHPRWSPLGRMLHDAAAALTAAAALPGVDGATALAAGYATGALVGAHLLVSEPRLAGAALVAPSAGEPLLPAGGRGPAAGLVDVLAAAGTRPVLVLAPRVGGEARAALASARAAGVEYEELDDHHRLSPVARRVVRAWLRGALAPARAAA